MIKMFLDDSLHHTFTYVDQPLHTLLLCNPGPLSHIKSVWAAMPLFCNKVVFCIVSFSCFYDAHPN